VLTENIFSPHASQKMPTNYSREHCRQIRKWDRATMQSIKCRTQACILRTSSPFLRISTTR